MQYQTGNASLFAVMARQNGKCRCFEYVGDNPECPVHPVHLVKLDETAIPAKVVNARLTTPMEDVQATLDEIDAHIAKAKSPLYGGEHVSTN